MQRAVPSSSNAQQGCARGNEIPYDWAAFRPDVFLSAQKVSLPVIESGRVAVLDRSRGNSGPRMPRLAHIGRVWLKHVIKESGTLENFQQ
jgi:hypothetical protein